jgi:hypothetical protein
MVNANVHILINSLQMSAIRFGACVGIGSSLLSLLGCTYFLILLRDRVTQIQRELHGDMADFNAIADEAWQVNVCVRPPTNNTF